MRIPHDPTPARFNSLEDAEAFLKALEANPAASPYGHGAVDPYKYGYDWLGRVINNQISQEYKYAPYELEIWADREVHIIKRGVWEEKISCQVKK